MVNLKNDRRYTFKREEGLTWKMTGGTLSKG
jgi:hypothetical protein